MRPPLIVLLALLGCETEPPAPAAPSDAKQVLFGDLHVHSTQSIDALVFSTPMLSGRGVRGPAVHCDFARWCAQVDFWAITDHPEGALPSDWTGAQAAIRACNALTGGDGDAPALVSFLGWEWTQSSWDAAADWGHKNVILLDTAAADVPARPVAAGTGALDLPPGLLKAAVSLVKRADPENADAYDEVGDIVLGGLDAPLCPHGVDTRALPPGCREVADTPAELYEKLDQWGFDALVIPHGTAWGSHHPALAGWGLQLDRRQHDPRYERLVEIYSGHGSSEALRPWREVAEDAGGAEVCPPPSDGYEPCCWRAGELTRRSAPACAGEAAASAECEARVARARQEFVDAEPRGAAAFPDVPAEEWGACGQCTDCFQPAFGYRPGFSVQAALAQTSFEDPDDPLRYRLGFVGSTDSHAAGPGAGYKELAGLSDIYGPASPEVGEIVDMLARVAFPDWERQSSYYYPGGLVAVHAAGRSRRAIWEALKRREVYATSGDRILLWFDLVGGSDAGPVPMGGEAVVTQPPEFEVRAVGAFEQAPGCPDRIRAAAPDGFVDEVCLGECYHPTDERYRITRIEVVRIRPQVTGGEPLDGLVDDPFAVLDCEPDPEGCAVRFSDPTLLAGGRGAHYYVRAIQEPTPQFNADGLRCEPGEDGPCERAEVCWAGHRAEAGACMADDEERAWSSPIWVVPGAP